MTNKEQVTELDDTGVSPPIQSASSSDRSLARIVPQVPQSQKPVLAAFLRYDEAKRKSLLHCLENAGPFVIAEGMEDRISKALDVNRAEAISINNTLTSIYAAHESAGLTSDMVLQAIKSDEQLERLIDENTEANIIHFFNRLFSLKESFGVATRAHWLTRQQDNTYCFSEITTDLRPVFDEADESAIAAGIVHNLRISYHKHASDGDFFVALDATDLRELRQQIDSALKKDTALRKLASGMDLPVMKE